MTDVFVLKVLPEKRNVFMKNDNEAKDVLGDLRKRYRARGKRSHSPHVLISATGADLEKYYYFWRER